MTTTQPSKPRYSVRKVGSKHDYVRKFAVIDTTTGRRVRYSLTDDKADAVYQAEELNAHHEGREPKSYAEHLDDVVEGRRSVSGR